MIIGPDLSKHYKLLQAENKKIFKKKRILFSELKAESFEEIAKIRKMREEQLTNFVTNKNKTNMIRLNSKERLLKKKALSNTSSKLTNKINTKFNESIPEKNNYITNESNINTNKGIEGSNFNSNQIPFIDDNASINKIDNSVLNKTNSNKLIELDHNININKKNELDVNKSQKSINKGEIINENDDRHEGEIRNEEEKIDEDEDEENKKIQELIAKANKEQEEKEKILLEKLEKEKNEKLLLEAKNQKEKEENEAKEKKLKEEEEKIKLLKIQASLSSFILILTHILNKTNSQKLIYYKELFDYMKQKVEDNFESILNYEEQDKSFNQFMQIKSRHFNLSTYYKEFVNSVKQLILNKRMNNYYNEKSRKYLLYRQYKIKALSFGAMVNFTNKQREWIHKIQNELLKSLIWNCFDSWKLYVNYKKVKRYFKEKKTKLIFDALKNNQIITIEMSKKSKRVILIFLYKSFFKRVRKNLLIKKGKFVNEKIAYEFRRLKLMNSIFRVLYFYYKTKKEKEMRSKKNFIMKHQDKEYINIQVTQKETVKYNDKDNSAFKLVSQKINII